MRYMLMVYNREADWAALSQADKDKAFGEYMGLSAELREKGKNLYSAPLQSVSTATTVRIRDGKAMTTDGPFAETREQFGGFYLVEAKDLDEAIAIAQRIPAARIGCVEVRPVMEIPGA